MLDPQSSQVPGSAPSSTRRRGGVALAIAATTLMVGGLAWPAFRGGEVPAAPATLHAAGPAPLVSGGPVVASYADVVQQVSPAVVAVRSSRLVQPTSMGPGNPFRRFFGEEFGEDGPHREGGLGSGVVVSGDGYILTNNHVVAGAERVTVDFVDGRSLAAKVVGTDPPSDLAVLKVSGAGFRTLPLADSNQVRVGDVVLAVGHPLGLGQTVTMGIISAKDRATGASRGTGYEDFLQTDAPINRGNSGGALVNLRGELVGINSQIMSPTGGNIGIGFAIPSSMAHEVMTQLVERGTVRRGLLGVGVQGVDADIARSLGLSEVRGAIVNLVNEDGPAEHAGIKQGDVILSLDGKPIDSSNALRNAIGRLAPGTKVSMEIAREGAKKTVTATLAERPVNAEAADDDDAPAQTRRAKPSGRYGLDVEVLTPELAREMRTRTRSGVVVAGVDPAGAASEAGLQQYDVILEVNRARVVDGDALKAALDRTPAGKPALVLIERRGETRYLTLERPPA